MMAEQTNPVAYFGLTARDVDLEARLQFDAWEAGGFWPDAHALGVLNTLVRDARAYVPAYVLVALSSRGY